MNAAILIPVFNHARSVGRVIADVRAALADAGFHPPIFVLDDGSTDGTHQLLAEMSDITLLNHTRNRGKGAALIDGFEAMSAAGFTHAITLDADAQHHPTDVVKIFSEAIAHPSDLIIGHRDIDAPGNAVPLASRKGGHISRFWLRVETGQRIPDSQCGLRAYPLASTLAVPHRFKRYDFETEILARLAWGAVRIRNVPIRCIYFPPRERVTHFRPVVDSLRAVRVHLFLVTRRLLPAPFKKLVTCPADAEARFGKWWKLASSRDAIRDMLSTGSTNSDLAMAFAMGIFVGLTPFYFVQTILAIYFARRLHLNVMAAVIGSQISIPPLVPMWATLSYAVGNLFLKGKWAIAEMKTMPWTWDFRDWSIGGAWPFLVGNFLVAATVAIASLFIARGLLYCVRGQRVPADVGPK